MASNTVAECRALFDGLRLCKRLRLQDVLVYSDSSVVMNWLASGICRLWFLWDFWEEIKELANEINARMLYTHFSASKYGSGFLGEGRDAWC